MSFVNMYLSGWRPLDNIVFINSSAAESLFWIMYPRISEPYIDASGVIFRDCISVKRLSAVGRWLCTTK